MKRAAAALLALAFGVCVHARDDEQHSHPAPEKLGNVLLDLNRPEPALQEFRTVLTLAPARRGALVGAITAAEQLGDTQAVRQLQTQLTQ